MNGQIQESAGTFEPVVEPDWSALALQRFPMLEACELPGIDEKLLCGTIEVFEDRGAQSGKRIGLNVVVVPAASAKHRLSRVSTTSILGPGVPSDGTVLGAGVAEPGVA